MKISSPVKRQGFEPISFASFTVLLRQLFVVKYDQGRGSVGLWLWRYVEMGAPPALGMRMQGPIVSEPGKIQSVEILPYAQVSGFHVDYVVSISHHISPIVALDEVLAVSEMGKVQKYLSKAWNSWERMDEYPTYDPGGLLPGWGWIRDPQRAEYVGKEEE